MPKMMILLQRNLSDFVSVLIKALRWGHTDSVALVIDQPWFNELINIQCPKTGYTLLHSAFRHGRMQIVSLLIRRPDIDFHVTDRDGYIPFQYLSNDLRVHFFFIVLYYRPGLLSYFFRSTGRIPPAFDHNYS
jgi:ankyrin repeat protein